MKSCSRVGIGKGICTPILLGSVHKGIVSRIYMPLPTRSGLDTRILAGLGWRVVGGLAVLFLYD